MGDGTARVGEGAAAGVGEGGMGAAAGRGRAAASEEGREGRIQSSSCDEYFANKQVMVLEKTIKILWYCKTMVFRSCTAQNHSILKPQFLKTLYQTDPRSPNLDLRLYHPWSSFVPEES